MVTPIFGFRLQRCPVIAQSKDRRPNASLLLDSIGQIEMIEKMSENYFEIKKLKCAYNQRNRQVNDIVLDVEELTIPKGEIVFIVGQSGCGKSTLLETLGLMNNTMLVSSDTVFDFYSPNNNKIDFTTIWSQSNDIISNIRLNHFSFIFQQTNLMHNFNIYENIAITKMLQGANTAECRKSTNTILDKLGLKEFVIMENGGWSPSSKVFNKPHEASGGQQQRMAFARAMVAKYDLLFCDEPTGNLDPKSADKLMSYLHDEVKTQNNVTTIVVTHDLPLAARYGDRIIKIFKKQPDMSSKTAEKMHYGYISKDSLFLKQNGAWTYNSESMSDEQLFDILRNWDNESI